MLLERLRPRSRTNPLFYAERLRRLLADEPERLRRMLHDGTSVDALTWNVFSSLDSDDDRDYLAAVLEPVGGADLAAPMRMRLWSGAHREPLARPSPAYVRHLRARLGEDPPAEFTAPVEIPVRIESPRALVLVDTMLGSVTRGAGGRDRLVELVDVGLEQAGNLATSLTVAVVYPSGTPVAREVSARMNQLRDAAALAAALPWRAPVPEVRFRELSWQRLLALWDAERDHLELSGEPVRAFRAHCGSLGLR